MKNLRMLLQLIYIANPSKGKILFALLCSLLNKICDIVPEILIGMAIDVVVNQNNSIIGRLGIINPVHQMYCVAIFTAILWILESIFEFLYSIAWYDFACHVQQKIRLYVYDTIQNLDLVYFEHRTTGQLLNIVQGDIDQLGEFLSKGPNEIIQLSVNTIVMGGIFFYLSPMLCFSTLAPLPFVIGIAYYFQNKLALLYDSVRHASASLASHIAYRLQGITTIKSFTTESYELKQLQKESQFYYQISQKANMVNAFYIPFVRMAIMIGFIMALFLGGVYALQGIIPINWYATLVFLTQRFLWPFAHIAHLTDMYERSIACARRIQEILSYSQIIVSGNEFLDSTQVRGAIIFNNVYFAYPSGIKIFDNLSFEIPAKKTVAFVGATGSGKSSLVKLLLRFYDYDTGTIMLDTQVIKNISLEVLRSSIALVSQDIYLINGTIADNIAYGTFSASKIDIIEAAKIAQIHDFIMSLPYKYDTPVQEYGKNFSGGQKQRFAIARAMLKKAPIIIFDEATSALDNETQAALQKALNTIAHNCTVIIIAHRLATVCNADIIFVLEHGSIVESGTHEFLLNKDGVYAKIWNA